MITKEDSNSHKKDPSGQLASGIVGRLTKVTVKAMPSKLPAKIYHFSSKIPGLKGALEWFIKKQIPETVLIDEGTLYLDRSDVAVSGALAMGVFEKFETEIFRNSIKEGMNVVDVGANIGYYTLIAAKRTGSGGRVFSYEPEDGNFKILEKNVKANMLNNVSLNKKALSDKDGQRDLFLEKNNRGHHSFAKSESTFEKVSVPTETLDESLKRFGSPKIDLIKIDIEGAEPIALRGMKKTTEQNKNLIIFTEAYPKSMERLGESATSFLYDLRKLGFSLYFIDESKEELIPIKDIDTFITDFPKGESFKNILAKR